MNNTSSLEEMSRTGTVTANLILRHHKLGLMARLMEIKAIEPKMKRKEIAKEFGFSSSTLQRYRYEKKLQLFIN